MRFCQSAFLCALIALPALAQNYPARPIRAILPFGAGTPTDVIARAIGQKIAPALGQPLVVENRPGANGIIGTEACAKAAPDGYTVCFVTNPQISINPFLYAKLPYDPPRDFAPVVQLGTIVNALAVDASLPVNSLRELIELARAKPGTVNWASWGMGSTSHLFLAWLENRTGARFNHVLYKEPTQAWAALLKGESNAGINTAGLIGAMSKAGKLKALAVSASRRTRYLPDVPTFQELGLDLKLATWMGALVPAATPAEVVQRLNTEMNKPLADPKVLETVFAPLGVEPAGGASASFAAYLKADREVTAEAIRLAGVKPQ